MSFQTTGDPKEVPLPLRLMLIENVAMSIDLQELRDFIVKCETEEPEIDCRSAKLLLFYAIELTELSR